MIRKKFFVTTSRKSRAAISKMNLAIQKSIPKNHTEEHEQGQYSNTPSLHFQSLKASKYRVDRFPRTSIRKPRCHPESRFAIQDIHFY